MSRSSWSPDASVRRAPLRAADAAAIQRENIPRATQERRRPPRRRRATLAQRLRAAWRAWQEAGALAD